MELEILDVTKRLLEAIRAGDWDTYRLLCDDGLTCFEPESAGHLVEGLEFHKFYFDLGGHLGPHSDSIVNPKIWPIGSDGAVIAYVRLVQSTNPNGSPLIKAYGETRVWKRVDGEWKHLHFHRSAQVPPDRA